MTRYGTYFSAAAVLALSAAPIAARAQNTISAQAKYTKSVSELESSFAGAKSAMPLLTTKQAPLASLLRNNARPSTFGAAGAVLSGGQSGKADLSPNAFGNGSPLAIAPYTTAGAYSQYGGPGPTLAHIPVTSFPWRATGKLYFNIGSSTYVCSGSMIKPGILLTAAHCVYSYGNGTGNGFYTNHVFYPGLADSAPFGSWTAGQIWIPTVYYNGTDNCWVTGVVCNNDIAVIIMNTNGAGLLPGQRLSWYGYGWNGYSYLTSFGGAFLSHLTQLGYPQAFDYGTRMERTDGIGALFIPQDGMFNTILGSAQTGGSSGGPWMVNFGAPPAITGNASLGNAAVSNVVVGVTSWGYTSVGTNTQGASWFGQNAQFPGTYTDSHGVYRGAGNIAALVSSACSSAFDHC